jgi:hypothetical protein
VFDTGFYNNQEAVMELHRSRRNDRKLAFVGIGYGLVAFAVGLFFAMRGGGAVTVVLWASGALFFVAGIIVLLGSLRPFQIAFSDWGMTVHTDSLDFEGSWDVVEAINIETIRIGEATEERRFLVVWLNDSVPMRRPPTFPPNAIRKGYVMAELVDLKEPPDQVAAVLTRYAGQKHRHVAQV